VLHYFLGQEAQDPTFFDHLLTQIDAEAAWGALPPETQDTITAVHNHFFPNDLAEQSSANRSFIVIMHVLGEMDLTELHNQAVAEQPDDSR
jgi:hypothetical protein